jgi:phage major head subunit gpT-like protein
MYNSPIAVLKGIRTEFSKQLANFDGPMFKAFVQTINGDGAYEDFRFLDSVGTIRQWTDQRRPQNYRDFLVTLRPLPYEFTINVNRHTLDDSKKTLGGDIEKDVREAAMLWKTFSDRLVNDLIAANGVAYDKSTFFATSHNIDGATAIDNLISGTGTTLAQIEADLASARNAMHGYRDKNNQPINMNPRFVALIPSQLHDKFLTLRNSQQIYDGAGNKTNIYNNSFDIIINHWQATNDNDWFLINTNANLMPFMIVDRQKPRWEIKDDLELLDIRYMSDARMVGGYGAFTSIAKVNN